MLRAAPTLGAELGQGGWAPAWIPVFQHVVPNLLHQLERPWREVSEHIYC